MALYNKELNSLYIHIPKCYGNSIKDSLRQVGFKNLLSKDIMNYSKGTLQLLADKNLINLDNTFIFTFIRNPNDRFVSGCNFTNTELNDIINLNVNDFNVNEYWHILMPQINHLKLNQYSNVKHIDFIGICENIENDWIKLNCKLKKLGLNYDLPKLKVLNKSKSNLSISIPNNIKELFKEDYELFNLTSLKN